MPRYYPHALLLVFNVSCTNNMLSGNKPAPAEASSFSPHHASASKVGTGNRAGGLNNCRIRASLSTNLDEDSDRETVTWQRCGPEEIIEVDGGLEYPVDTVVVTSVGSTKLLYSNSDSPQSCGMASIGPLHFDAPAEQVLIVWYCYGTGNIRAWNVVDLRHHGVRNWQSPELAVALKAYLKPDERLGKQVGAGPLVQGDVLALEFLVYGPGDPACCATRENIRVELTGSNGVLQLSGVSRVAPRVRAGSAQP